MDPRRDPRKDEPDRDAEQEKTKTRRWRWAAVVAVILVVSIVGAGLIIRKFASPTASPATQIADVSSERLLALGSTVGFAAAHDTHAWLGMPYARPPVDGLRWRVPEPPEAWADTLDALRFGPPCVQLGSALGGVASDDPDGFVGSEDCLYLNVWSPRSEPDRVAAGEDRLPVMVWIHGGGNRTGHSGSPMYDGARLAGMENVVVVSFNYRLGPFGWFSHAALRSESATREESSGNFGTLDQVRALEWVQSNIEEFGGNADNVTIFGESAGGTNVLALLLVNEARDLFHRAIVQSGSTASVSRAEAENDLMAETPGQRHSSAEIVVALLEGAGVVPDREAARGYAASLPASDLAEFLRDRPAREIVEAYRSPDRPEALEVPVLIRDGALLPLGDWNAEYRAGRFNRVPIILGSNRDEMKLFLFGDDEHVKSRFGMLFRIRDVDDYERRSRYHSDLWRVRGVTRPASAISIGMASVPSVADQTNIFSYRFDWDELPHFMGTDLAQLLGAAHGFEIPFVLGNFDLGNPFFNRLVFNDETEATREALSLRLMGYWGEFARNGRPGRGSDGTLPEWEPWTTVGVDDGASATMLILDTEAGGGIRLAKSSLSRDHVIAAVDAERGLGQDEKCDLFHDLFSETPGWSAERYRGIGRRGCADYPRVTDAQMRPSQE